MSDFGEFDIKFMMDLCFQQVFVNGEKMMS